jgi:(p)ppGpp synthase/HD superfamily hydrolase
MHELVERAERFAVGAHRRVDHRRKYSGQPYDAHLRAVAELVGTVSSDPEMLAAAWLHDVLEDTPATYEDVEREFGVEVADASSRCSEKWSGTSPGPTSNGP